jgi:hypothetical protein
MFTFHNQSNVISLFKDLERAKKIHPSNYDPPTNPPYDQIIIDRVIYDKSTCALHTHVANELEPMLCLICGLNFEENHA